MVVFSAILFKHARKAVPRKLRGKFMDSVRLNVKGGHGGNGVPKYGGVGGQGGCVYFVAKDNVSLRDVIKKHTTKRIEASPGEESSKARLLGRRGTDVCVEVPVGVTVYDDNNRIIGELNKPEDTCIAAGGGGGGCTGNAFIGKIGENRNIRLDLKLIADVGLIGFPNAGKSTLLKAISNATPKIAAYPFTTIRPQLGSIGYRDYRQITIADLPGLIEGAHANIGMGHNFLRHVERTRLLLLMVDVFGFQLSPSHRKRNWLENVFALNKELALYDPQMFEKPAILLINKLDIEGSEDELNKHIEKIYNINDHWDECPEEMRHDRCITFERIMQISAKESTNIPKVKEAIREVLDESAEKKLKPPTIETFKRKIEEIGPKVY